MLKYLVLRHEGVLKTSFSISVPHTYFPLPAKPQRTHEPHKTNMQHPQPPPTSKPKNRHILIQKLYIFSHRATKTLITFSPTIIIPTDAFYIIIKTGKKKENCPIPDANGDESKDISRQRKRVGNKILKNKV